jgi:hypothetical protein
MPPPGRENQPHQAEAPCKVLAIDSHEERRTISGCILYACNAHMPVESALTIPGVIFIRICSRGIPKFELPEHSLA